jgi:tRNA(fMet)-specific endonuclease VapC
MKVTYLIDTNTVSYIAKGRSPAARARLDHLSEDEIACISSLTEAELRYGLARRPAARALRAAIEGMLFKFRILPWGSREAGAYGDLRAKLEETGIALSEMDLLLAAHAIAVDAVFVTNDRAFSRVKTLRRVENWAIDV